MKTNNNYQKSDLEKVKVVEVLTSGTYQYQGTYPNESGSWYIITMRVGGTCVVSGNNGQLTILSDNSSVSSDFTDCENPYCGLTITGTYKSISTSGNKVIIRVTVNYTVYSHGQATNRTTYHDFEFYPQLS